LHGGDGKIARERFSDDERVGHGWGGLHTVRQSQARRRPPF
jgi:hypothetical protein